MKAREQAVRMIATFFGAGYSPWAPGTMGSLAGILISWFAGDLFWPLLALLIFLGFAVSKPAVSVFASGDPSAFVMDEVVGMMISVSFLPKTIFFYGGAFILFRLFDITKPWPISLIQKSKHPWAIMGDDILAGVFANLLIYSLLLTYR